MRVKVSAEDDARFERELPLSLAAVDAVAGHLRLSGWDVEVRCDRKYVDRWSYKDKPGDLIMRRDGKELRGEVKGRRVGFTCCSDFPFPTIIVDRATKKVPLCDYYFTVSTDLRYMAVIALESKDRWSVSSVEDKRRGYSAVKCYFCPKEEAVFRAIKKSVDLRKTTWAAYLASPGDDTLRSHLDTIKNILTPPNQ
jgi:hypothetical protein